jgi:hypothetical protein
MYLLPLRGLSVSVMYYVIFKENVLIMSSKMYGSMKSQKSIYLFLVLSLTYWVTKFRY